MQNILVINAGSSSIKYQLIDVDSGTRLATGLVERIGEVTPQENGSGGGVSGAAVGRVKHRGAHVELEWQAEILDHYEGFRQLTRAFAESGTPLDELGVVAVGHRVVQGGSEFVEPTLIDEAVAARILELAALAPLHNPGHHSAIVAARAAFAEVPHVAVFDTSFHQTMLPEAYTYAIDPQVASQHGIRRYGFHGISHQVVSQRTAAVLGKPVHALKQIVLHIGNGASISAIDRGRSIDTSMGLTPLEGLVMGTRSGDIDPGVLMHLLRAGMTVDEVDRLLNKQSGLFGMAGSNDMRDVRAAANSGDEAAKLALEVYVHRLRHYVGAYLLELGGADAIVFTAGVGENHPALRAEVCAGLEWFGIEIDQARNEAESDSARVISTDESRVALLVVPTDEEAEIARQTRMLVSP